GRARGVDGERVAEDGLVGMLLRQAVLERLPALAGVAGPVHAQARLGRAAEAVGLERQDVHAVGSVWVLCHREPEVRGQLALAAVGPGVARVVGTIDAPMVLEKEALRPRRMERELVRTVPELRVLLAFGEKRRTHVLVLRGPGVARVVGAIDARRG